MKKPSRSKPESERKFADAGPVWESAHQKALEAGEDFYIDPETGYRVWTVQNLENRGHCCDSGCRHCPYKKD